MMWGGNVYKGPQPDPPPEKTERDFYVKEGDEYKWAYDNMANRIVPPSLDVFMFGHKKMKKLYKNLSVTQYSDMISERK